MQTLYPEKPVLIADDEKYILQSLSGVLRSEGIKNIMTCSDSRELMSLIRENEPSLVLLDLTMPHRSGEDLLPEIRDLYPDLPVIIITGVNELSTAVSCMKNGAADYLVKAIENSKLLSAVRNALSINKLKEENRMLKKGLLSDPDEVNPAFRKILTNSRAMKSIFRYLSLLSKTENTILIRGETGTGKELAAEGIHSASGRTGGYVSVNAAGLDDTMFSDALFGHKKGAYSGADDNRPGLIEKAAGGTLFLDEIGDLTNSSQLKLLRLLEKGEYYTLGSDVLKRASCRILAATNRNLEEMMEEGIFRKDLYYRLSSCEVVLPPLRDRADDIPLLAEKFVSEAAKALNLQRPEITPGFIKALMRMDFPGNIRELMSAVSRSISNCDGRRLTEDCLGNSATPGGNDVDADDTGEGVTDGLEFPDRLPWLKQWSDLLVDEALKRSGGNISTAAEMLGISQPALSKRLSKR